MPMGQLEHSSLQWHSALGNSGCIVALPVLKFSQGGGQFQGQDSHTSKEATCSRRQGRHLGRVAQRSRSHKPHHALLAPTRARLNMPQAE